MAVSSATRKKISIAQKTRSHENQRGPAHGMWKGDAVGLTALHDWVHLRLPRPDACQKCGVTGKPLDLHNIDKKYTRDLSQWIYLCKKCHAKEEEPARRACQSPTARKKRGDALRGRKRPEEVGRKVSESKKIEWASISPEAKANRLKHFIKRPIPLTMAATFCACGCGELIINPDNQGRWHRFILYHNAKKRTFGSLARRNI
jgi:hypothetical protein